MQRQSFKKSGQVRPLFYCSEIIAIYQIIGNNPFF